MKKKWPKIWREFNNWWNSSTWPNWDSQRRKLNKLIRSEFGGIDMLKVWAYYNKECNEKEGIKYSLSWRQQQNIIKKAVQAHR